MTKTLLLSIASIAGAIALPTSALLAARSDDAPRAVVSYADLNLADDTGAARLRHRVANAAKTVCGDVDMHNLRVASTVRACRRESIALVQPNVDLAIGNARGEPRLAQAQTNPNKSLAR